MNSYENKHELIEFIWSHQWQLNSHNQLNSMTVEFTHTVEFIQSINSDIQQIQIINEFSNKTDFTHYFQFRLFLIWRILRKNGAYSPWGEPFLNIIWNRCHQLTSCPCHLSFRNSQKFGHRMATNAKFVTSSHFPAWSPILPLRLARMMNQHVTAGHLAWNETGSINDRIK